MQRQLRFTSVIGSALSVALIACYAANAQENIATSGQGILGYAAVDDGTLGTEYEHAGGVENVNDGNMATRSDTWGGAASDVTYDYVGVVWPDPIPPINTVRLTMATFFDGGWFGTGGAGNGRALTADDVLPVPKLQLSVDGGDTRADLPSETNYAADLVGTNLGGGAFPNPSSTPTVEFSFETIGGINGIRVFGEGGGNAGEDSGGFLGVFELEVMTVPEPGTLTLVWGLMLVGFIRRRIR